MFVEIQKFKMNNITCPYCDWEDTVSWEREMDNGDTLEIECQECNKKFYTELIIDVSYSSHGLCTENNTKHNWIKFDNWIKSDHCTDEKIYKGKHCLTCDKYEYDKKIEISNKKGESK